MKSLYLKQNILPNNGPCFYIQDFVSEPNLLFDRLLEEIQWRNDKIKMFGKIMDQPRKVAWYGDESIEYTYSGIKMMANEWSETLLVLKDQVETTLNHKFNSVLINLYRDGNDYMSWHSDDEKELGINPVIASISLGAARDFLFRLKNSHQEKVKLQLASGSLLVMQGQTQQFWQHTLPKRKKVFSPRLNLTFRQILI